MSMKSLWRTRLCQQLRPLQEGRRFSQEVFKGRRLVIKQLREQDGAKARKQRAKRAVLLCKLSV